MLLVQAVLFYLVHKAFHEVKSLWWTHRFHHKFNDVILPSSASAVSFAEYVLAYIFPLWVGAMITSPDPFVIDTVIHIITLTNLLIHSPFMQDKQYPSWLLVTADDHFRHHRKLTCDYAAPVINCDSIIEAVEKKLS